MAEEMLIETDAYLKTGAHIGTRFKSGDMARYIYKVRKDGLKVLNVTTIDSRLRIASKFLAKFPGKKIAVVSRKLYGRTAVKAFAEAVGAVVFTGRFVPGTFTNSHSKKFLEPDVVIVTEPENDAQAVDEAGKVNIPVVGLCTTNNSTRNIDLVVPLNNKGRKSIALAYWLMAREILKARGEIKSNEEFKKTVEEFEYIMKEGETEEEESARMKSIAAMRQQRGKRMMRGGRQRRDR